MKHEEAVDLVFDLISAVRDLEAHGGRSYREHYEELRERVIKELSSSPSSTNLGCGK